MRRFSPTKTAASTGDICCNGAGCPSCCANICNALVWSILQSLSSSTIMMSTYYSDWSGKLKNIWRWKPVLAIPSLVVRYRQAIKLQKQFDTIHAYLWNLCTSWQDLVPSLVITANGRSSSKQFYIIHHHFLPFPFKKVVCFFFFSRHPWNHTNCQGCSHRGRQSHNSGWTDRPKPGSRYKWIMLWHNDMLLNQHASNLEIKKLKWIFVIPPPRPWPLIIFSEILSKKSSTSSPGREEVVPTFALPWSTDPPGFPTSIESTELQVLRDSQAKWLPIWSTMLRCCCFLCELFMRAPYLPWVVPWIWRELEVLPCSHWSSTTGGFIISRVNMQDD